MVDPEAEPESEAVEDAPSAEDAAAPEDAEPDYPQARRRLRSFTDVNLTIGQFMAGLEQRILHNRPPAVVVVEEQARSARVTTNGLTVDNLPTEALDRPEPTDTSGAKL
jgi:hypothetical protein